MTEIARKVLMYKNAIVHKFKNKRVALIKRDQGYCVKLYCIDIDPSPRVISEHFKNKAHLTYIRLTDEAMQALVASYLELNKTNH